MMRSMFAGVSGLRSHQTMMDVVGNNIANVNTTGFKASRVLFQDVLSQTIRGGSGGDGTITAGINPQQVGLGVRVGSIDIVQTQGASQLTGRATDVAIQGDGFFVVRLGTEQLHTRAGSFSFDRDGFLVDPSGAVVQGWVADNAGVLTTNTPISDIQLPVDRSIPPVATTTVDYRGNLSSTVQPGDPAIVSQIGVYDDQGTKHTITLSATKDADNDWNLEVLDPLGATITNIDMTFDPASGNLTSPAPGPITFTPPGGAAAITFTLDFGVAGSGDAVTQYGGASSAAAVDQNGASSGTLRGFAISDDGTVTGVFSNGETLTLAQLAMSKFTNPSGLVKAGNSHYRAAESAGSTLIGVPGAGGFSSMSAGTLEMSNVDLAQEFTNMIIAQRGFQANSRIISVSDEMLQELVNLKR